MMAAPAHLETLAERSDWRVERPTHEGGMP